MKNCTIIILLFLARIVLAQYQPTKQYITVYPAYHSFQPTWLYDEANISNTTTIGRNIIGWKKMPVLVVYLGDTIRWGGIYMGGDTTSSYRYHTITTVADSIPIGASSFDYDWDNFLFQEFKYVPNVTGLYKYICIPHFSKGMYGYFVVYPSPSNTCSGILL